jgi:hypothetical protein
VPFEGFSIHLKSHFQSLLGDVDAYPVTQRAHWGELYFETEDLQPIYQRLNDAGVAFIHPICEQPWGQRVMRFYDPDGHIIEIGETMEAVVWRFHERGLSTEIISEKSGMPRGFIESVSKNTLSPPRQAAANTACRRNHNWNQMNIRARSASFKVGGSIGSLSFH